MTFCPATMCPLFAAGGSPWTGEKNGACPQKSTGDDGCLWWQGFGGCGCDGATSARNQVFEIIHCGDTLQVGPVVRLRDPAMSKEYDCPRASDCQWQQESGDSLCPPRLALSFGIDPKSCAY